MLNLYRIYYFNLMKGEGMEKTRITRPLALILAIIMSFGSFQGIVFADESEGASEKREIEFQASVKVIAELEGKSILDLANEEGKSLKELDEDLVESRNDEIQEEQERFKADLDKQGIEYELNEDYDTALNAMSLTVDSQDIDKIKNLDNVKAVHSQNAYKRPETRTSEAGPYMLHSHDLIGANKYRDNLEYRGEGTVVAVLDTGVDHEHKDMDASKLEGKDVKLIEEKVNQIIAEEELKGEFKTLKVPYAYDYHDNDRNAKQNGPEQHGMHCAGTVGANGDPDNGGINGVAPDTQILAMKVFSDNPDMPWVYTDTVLKAIDDSIKLGADAINLSLGGDAGFSNGDFDSAQQAMYQKAIENGIICAIATGNARNSNYDKGIGSQHSDNPDQAKVGSPATLPQSLAVASFNNTHIYTRLLKSTADPNRNILTTTHQASPFDLMRDPKEFYYAGYGKPSDYEYKDENGEMQKVNLKGKIALVQRGTDEKDNKFGTYTEKKNYALAAGAEGIVIFNHKEGGNKLMNMLIDPPYNIPMAFIGHDDGMFLKENAGKISLQQEPDFVPSPDAGKMAEDSSWGPTADLRMKPEIMAPGANIYSTQNDNKYMQMSGTSMATPHVAGGLAVVREYINKTPYFDESVEIGDTTYSGESLREGHALMSKLLLMNTAVPKVNKAVNTYYSVNQQGAGLMNLKNAVNTPVYVVAKGTNDDVFDGKLEIKDGLDGSFEVELKLTNMTDKDQTYKLKETILSEKTDAEGFLTENTKKLTSSTTQGRDKITVPANDSVTVNFTVNYEGAGNNQFITGFIELENSSSYAPNLTVPILGFNGKWTDPKVLDGMLGFDENNFFNFARFAGNNNDPKMLPIREINGKKTVVFSRDTGVMPILTPLRNAESINFRIEDQNGKKIVDKITVNGVYKSVLDWWHTFSTWGGEMRSGFAQEGEVYNYVIEAAPNTPGENKGQINKYPVTIDKTAPKLEILSYDPNTRELKVKLRDELAGPNLAWIYDPENKNIGADLKNIEFSEDGTELIAAINVPKNFKDNLVLACEDRVWNSYEEPIDLGKLREKYINELPNEGEEGNLAKISPQVPKWLGSVSIERLDGNKDVDFTGGIPFVVNIKDFHKIEKVVLEEVVAAKSVEDEVLQIKKFGFDDLIKETDGSFTLNTRIEPKTKEGLVEIRIKVIDNGRESIVTHKFYLDKEKPKLDDLNVDVKDGVAKLRFDLSDNLNYIELMEYYNWGTVEEPKCNPLGIIGNKDGGWEHIYTDPIKAAFTTTLEKTKEGKEVFYYEAYDKVDNYLTFAVEIDWTTGEYKVYDSWLLENELAIPTGEEPEVQDPETTEPGEKDPEETEPGEKEPEVTEPEEKDPEKEKPGNNDSGKVEPEPELPRPNPDKEIDFDKDDNGPSQEINPSPDRIKPNPSPSVEAPDTDMAKDKDKTVDDKTKAPEAKIVELSGPNRIETAVDISKNTFDKADTVVIAQADGFADALAAGPLAAILDGPILLAGKTIDPSVVKEIERLGAKKVLIVGGENSVSADVLKILKDKGLDVQRVAGSNRYETSLEILGVLDKEGVKKDELILASGKNFADSLSIAPYAGINKYGILLVGDKLDTKMEARIKDAGRVLIVGGENSVAKAIEERVAALGKDVKRIAGDNRYETSAKIASNLFDNPKKLVIASGENYPDALTGTIKAIKEKAPILLTGKDSIDPSIEKEIKSIKAEEIFVLGGESTISKTVREKLK